VLMLIVLVLWNIGNSAVAWLRDIGILKESNALNFKRCAVLAAQG